MGAAQTARVRLLRAKLIESETRARGRSTSFSRSGFAKLVEFDSETESLDREIELIAQLINKRKRAAARATMNGLEVSLETDSCREEDVTLILETWRDRFSPRSSVRDRKRRARVEARLDDGRTVAELLKVLDGVERSDWHMGRDPRTRGKRYIGIETIYRDDAQVDKFLELAGGPAPPPPRTDAEKAFDRAVGKA